MEDRGRRLNRRLAKWRIKSMANKLYVAYGSNLNLAQMARRCPKAKVVGCGVLKDYQLTFRRLATIEPVKGAETPVGVCEITPTDERNLDIYEGYPSYYRKETVKVNLHDRTVEAMVYIMNGGEPQLPPDCYYKVIEQGYGDVGLDTKYLLGALDDTQKRMRAK